MVATMFACIVYSTAKGAPKAQSGKIDKPKEAMREASSGYRRAA